MKKLLYILLAVSFILSACKKEEEELEERRKRDTPRDSDRREAEKLKINEEDEELEEAQEQEVVEETISNDTWYQNELFESLKKRWTK